MNYQPLLTQVEDFVKKYMHEHDNPNLLYHNLAHTRNIVSVTNQIAKQYQLSDKEFFTVIAPAWFLYSGYYKDTVRPIEASTKIAEHFFENSGVEEETIRSIKRCILVTKNSKAPETLLEKIISDADSF